VSIVNQNEEIRNDSLAIWNIIVLDKGTYWLRLSADDTLGHESQDFVNVEVAKTAGTVKAGDGANLVIESGQIEIYIPPNALPSDTQVNIQECTINELGVINDPHITFASLCFKITPDNLSLSKPATLSLIYADPSIVDKNEKKLAIYHSSNGEDNWQRLGGSIKIEENKISTSFKQFGVFALYEDLTEGGESDILNANIQPRVFSPNGSALRAKADISFDLGKASTVNVKIYNTAGRLIAVLAESKQMNRGTNVLSWRGQNLSSNTCPSGCML